jgi:hypothetical protein
MQIELIGQRSNLRARMSFFWDINPLLKEFWLFEAT